MSQSSKMMLVAEFTDPEALVEAAEIARAEGLGHLEAYTPYPVEGLAEALGMEKTGVPWITLLCGLTGGALAYFMQYYSAVHDYPLNVGGRPLHSWPAFVPVTFEVTILCAAIGTIVGLLLLNRLPRLHHPIFETPHFDTRSDTRFYLAVEGRTEEFDPVKVRAALEARHPSAVWEVTP